MKWLFSDRFLAGILSREDKFYRGGTLTLTSQADTSAQPSPVIYDPYPDYNGEKFRACQGPRGRALDRLNHEDMVSVYPGVPEGDIYSWEASQVSNVRAGFPYPLIGSYAAMGLDASVCADRYSRFGAYGNGENRQHGAIPGFRSLGNIDWDTVNWWSLESQCFERNAERYAPSHTDPRRIEHSLPFGPSSSTVIPRDNTGVSSGLQFKSRSAVLLRAWHDMEWTENLKHYVRSLIMELSLHSGSEYVVYIICHVRDPQVSLNANDQEDMQRLKAKYIPPEFSDMTILFNDKILEAWYPKIEEHSTNLQYWQPVQIFSQLYPDFDFYWQLEMDARLTGHAYHFMEQAAKFAKEQPRKYLWERNSYFYIPGTHGTWQDFTRMVDGLMRNKESVWGPKPFSQLTPAGPKPPVAHPKNDNYEWGVGEEADVMTFLPIFDPVDTQWTYPNKVWNVPEETLRRASPVAMGRISKSLLHLIHDAQSSSGIGVVSEMTAPTFALWHGLKAVHVPHPLYVDGKWTSKELGRILNPGPPEKVNGARDSIWNFDHRWDHILFRLSYMFSTQTAEDLYRRWLGYKIDPNQYTDGTYHQDPRGRNWFENGDLREDLYGRLCYPSMLLHTIKNTAEKKGKDMAVPV
ncbi:hypothetical protein BBP40_001169 [Aspergillus hancockii]|nr:hypothetical protein BBP40_001169 [Aspergillus hancockii]